MAATSDDARAASRESVFSWTDHNFEQICLSGFKPPQERPQEIHPRQVQLRAEENVDLTTCLFACREKWLKSRQLGPILTFVNWLLAKVNLFQNW
jgi:hypothetical protein